MAGIGPARPMEHQLNPNFNKTPGVYSLPGGATAGNKHLHAAQAAAPAAGQMVRGRKGLVHPSKAAALEAKHGTYLKLQKDIAERKKAERQAQKRKLLDTFRKQQQAQKAQHKAQKAGAVQQAAAKSQPQKQKKRVSFSGV